MDINTRISLSPNSLCSDSNVGFAGMRAYRSAYCCASRSCWPLSRFLSIRRVVFVEAPRSLSAFGVISVR